MTDSIELHGNAGLYVMDGNAFSFQIGEGRELSTSPGYSSHRVSRLAYMNTSG